MKGISFTPAMVSEIQAGSKKQTRRIQQGNSPPYKVGDVLYVKERHRIVDYSPTCCNMEYAGDGQLYLCCYDDEDYQAIKRRKKPFAWMPGLYMRKNFHRSRIRITSVRSELLWAISREDAVAEGIKIQADGYYPDFTEEISIGFSSPQMSFISLFKKIHGDKAIRAEQRVWVIEFEKLL